MTEQSERQKVLHVITSLGSDGAQQMLLKVVRQMSSERVQNQVVSLHADYGHSSLRPHFEAAGITVFDLGLKRSLPSPRALSQLVAIIRTQNPSHIQGWMYHGNLAASAGRALARSRARLLWNIRHSIYNLKDEKFQTRQIVRLGAFLSPRVDRIIYCAQISETQHAALGYAAEKSLVIPNGFDISRFQPSLAAKQQLRELLSLPPSAVLIGNIGRYHPQKGHEKLLRAAARIVAVFPQVHFVLIGRDLDAGNPVINGLIQELGIGAHVHLLGQRHDISELMPGLDLFCLASVHGEGFPNVLGEAMACGVPCVATDIGASAEIIAGIGKTVAPGDPEALAAGMKAMLELTEDELNKKSAESRQRVLELYALEKVVKQYEQLYFP